MRTLTKKELVWLITGILVIGIFLGVALSCAVYIGSAEAEEENTIIYYCWVMCQPNSEVMLRQKPSKRSDSVGALKCNTQMITDGEEKNGWVHLIDVPNESGEGWIFSGYVTYVEPREEYHKYPVSVRGRVACRRWMNGPRRCWAYDGDILTVYLSEGEWCLTDRGFILVQYIDFGSRVDIENMNPDDMTWEED